MGWLEEHRKEFVFAVSVVLFTIALIISGGKLITGVEHMDFIFVGFIYGLLFMITIEIVRNIVSYVLHDTIRLRHAFDGLILFLIIDVMVYILKFDIEKVEFFFWLMAGVTILRILSSIFSPTVLGLRRRQDDDERKLREHED